jgi:hypothetical protein
VCEHPPLPLVHPLVSSQVWLSADKTVPVKFQSKCFV